MPFTTSMAHFGAIQLALAAALAVGLHHAAAAQRGDPAAKGGDPQNTSEPARLAPPPPVPVLLGPQGRRAEPGRPTTLRYVLGLAGPEAAGAFGTHPVHEHYLLAEGLRRNGDELLSKGGEEGELSWTFQREGLNRLGAGARLGPRPIQAAQMRAILQRSRGAGPGDDPLLEGPLGGEQARQVCEIVEATALVAVGDGRGSAALRKLGRPVELRLLAAPSSLRTSDELPVRVYVEGVGVSGTVLRAHGPDGAQRQALSDELGHAVLQLDRAGAWWIEFEHLRAGPTASDPLEWFRATTSFQVPPKDAPSSLRPDSESAGGER